MKMRLAAPLAAFALAACARPLPPAALAGSGPDFDPVGFFTGHVTSWGVEETGGGAPAAIITTDCRGTATGPGALRMVQVLRIGNRPPQTRIWQLRRIDAGSYVATANDMAGEADATVAGRTLHWRWVLRSDPGSQLANVLVEQWMYRMADGAVLVRTRVTKIGIEVAAFTEQFATAPD